MKKAFMNVKNWWDDLLDFEKVDFYIQCTASIIISLTVTVLFRFFL